MKFKRAKNLSDADILQIVELLDGWTGKLTWDLLIDAIEQKMFSRYTRQALDKKTRIKQAYELVKNRSRNTKNNPIEETDPKLQAALQRIQRLELENLRLKNENDMLLEQFARWAYNASTKDLPLQFLNQSLPSISRGRTF